MKIEENFIQTPHINCNKDDIASVVVMPGDPIRAKNFAEKYLEKIKVVNGVRGHYIYTGYYKNKQISVCPSYMGIGSAAIYCYELYKFANVQTIIRMGTCGGYNHELNVGDLLLINSFYTDSNFYESFTGKKDKNIVDADKKIINKVLTVAANDKIAIKTARTFSTDVFYTQRKNIWDILANKNKKCDVVEMEGFALQTIANYLGKTAITLLALSDNLVTKSFSTAEQRAEGLGRIFELTINTAIAMTEKNN